MSYSVKRFSKLIPVPSVPVQPAARPISGRAGHSTGCGLAEVLSFPSKRGNAALLLQDEEDEMAKKITNPALSAMREAAEVEPARARVRCRSARHTATKCEDGKKRE